jgi:signal transduction histidine kinase
MTGATSPDPCCARGKFPADCGARAVHRLRSFQRPPRGSVCVRIRSERGHRRPGPISRAAGCIYRGWSTRNYQRIVVNPNSGRRRIRILVAECGHGMTAITAKQIFEPFFTTKGSVGTGLWVCKQLIEKNSGSIQVRSNTHGKRKGTTFSILLPPGGGALILLP